MSFRSIDEPSSALGSTSAAAAAALLEQASRSFGLGIGRVDQSGNLQPIGESLGEITSGWPLPLDWWRSVRPLAEMTSFGTCRVCGARARHGKSDATVRTPDGMARHFTVTWCGHEHARDGSAWDIIVVADVSESRRVEQELHTGTSRLQSLLGNLHSGVLFEDDDRNVAIVNEELCRVFEMPVGPEVLVGQNCETLMESARGAFADPDGFADLVNRRVAERVTHLGDEIVLADGRVLDRDYIPVTDGDEFLGHLWQYRDVTERRLAEQELARAERRRRAALQASLDPLLVLDEDGRILEANDASARTFGWTGEELRGRSMSEVLLSGDLSAGMRRDSARRCDGSVFPCEVSVTESPEEAEPRFLAVVRDLTDAPPARR